MKLSEIKIKIKINPFIKTKIKVFIVASTLALSGCASMTGWLNQPRNSAPAEVKVIPQKVAQYQVQPRDTMCSMNDQRVQTEPQAPQFIVTHNIPHKNKSSDNPSVDKSNILDDQITQIYVVQSGDTVLGIAYQNGMSLAQIAAENDLKPPYNIVVRQQLKVFVKSKVSVEVTKPESRKKEGPLVVAKPELKPELKAIHVEVKTEPRPIASKPKPAQKSSQTENALTAKQPTPEAELDKVNITQPSKNWEKPLHEQMMNEGMGVNGSTLYAASEGAPVYAVANGSVLYAGIGTQGYGEMVILGHGDGYLSAYSNLHGMDVKEGQAVSTGEKIGSVGKFRGKSHLGFEIRKDGVLIS